MRRRLGEGLCLDGTRRRSDGNQTITYDELKAIVDMATPRAIRLRCPYGPAAARVRSAPAPIVEHAISMDRADYR
jgi:hypothetical protein